MRSTYIYDYLSCIEKNYCFKNFYGVLEKAHIF